MGENTKIEWADHTFNPWWGCTRVSAGCANCYAETLAGRFGVGWGPNAERRPASEKVWNDPVRWNRAAAKAGVRARVFCSSMADVFENPPRASSLDLVRWRIRLFKLIKDTPWLDWLLLTKRPENIADKLSPMLPEDWGDGYRNVWLGVSVENQAAADTRIPILLRTPAAIRFISAEPLLGPVDLYRGGFTFLEPLRPPPGNKLGHERGLDWVIAGGESGHGARPMHPEWAQALRDQCQAAGVPFLFKQWGEWRPATFADDWIREIEPRDIRHIHESDNKPPLIRAGKKAAGRLLDGREWNEIPESRT